MLIKDGVRISPPKAFLSDFKKPVIFELHSSQAPISHITKNRSFPRSYGIEGFYQMMDNGKVVNFRYAETQKEKTRGGITETEYNPGEIEFNDKGRITCDPTVLLHGELYYWLSLHPRNEESVNFDTNKTPIFYEIKLEKEASSRLGKEIAEHDAKELILNTWNTSTLREAALEHGYMTAMDEDNTMLRDYLIKVMKKNPSEFLKTVKSEQLTRRAEVTEAIGYGIIRFNEKDKVWSWGTEEVQEGAQIVACMNDEDAKDRLLKFFDKAVRKDNIDYFNDRLKEERQRKKPKTEKSKEVVTS